MASLCHASQVLRQRVLYTLVSALGLGQNRLHVHELQLQVQIEDDPLSSSDLETPDFVSMAP